MTNGYVLPVVRRLANLTHLVAEKTRAVNILGSLTLRFPKSVANGCVLTVVRPLANLTHPVAEKTKAVNILGSLKNDFKIKQIILWNTKFFGVRFL